MPRYVGKSTWRALHNLVYVYVSLCTWHTLHYLVYAEILRGALYLMCFRGAGGRWDEEEAEETEEEEEWRRGGDK